MKKLLGATAVSLCLAAPAFAADMPVKARPAPAVAAVYSWTGFYLGVHGGIGFGNHDRSTGTFENEYDSDGLTFGGQAGYNYQMNNIVLGIEGDGAWTNIRGNDGNVGGTTDESKYKWLASVRGRLGLAWGRFMVYGTGGWAWTSVRHTNVGGVPTSSDHGLDGWTAGGGAEAMLTDNLSFGFEYRYYDFGRYTSAPTGLAQFTVDNTVQTFTGRLNYRFNWGGPVVARN